MRNLEIKNIKSHHSLSLAKANASRDLQINFNQAEDALTIPTESRHDYECGSTTQRGRSMIEMLGVLAIIGVLSVGGIAGYSKAMQKYRINKTIEQITLIASNIRTFFAPQRSYDGLTYKVIKKAKLVPDEMIELKNDGSINRFIDSFGNEVEINSNSASEYKSFTILYNLPEEACIELTIQDWSNLNVATVLVNNNAHDFAQHASYINGCIEITDVNSVVGCPNGKDVGFPIPLDKVVNPCLGGNQFLIEFK